MDCTKCNVKGCRRSSSVPCQDNSGEYVEQYQWPDNQKRTEAASKLIDHGRAGTLSRLQEIIEYAKLQGFNKIGCAYCYGMEKEAILLRQYLEQEGFKPIMVSCTVDQVLESTIDPQKTSQSVSCNPLGQANKLNASGSQLTLLMGLCLGHDIIVQKNLTMDFTTYVVKDRVHQHNPLLGLSVMDV